MMLRAARGSIAGPVPASPWLRSVARPVMRAPRRFRRGIEVLAIWSLSLAGHAAVFVLLDGQAMPQAVDQPTVAAMAVQVIELPTLSDIPPEAMTAAPEMTDGGAPDIAVALVTALSAPAVQMPMPDPLSDVPVPDHAPTLDTSPAPLPVVAKTPPPPKPVVKTASAPPRPKTTAKPADAAQKAKSGSKSAPQPAIAAQGGAGTKALLASWGKGILTALSRQSVRGRDMPKGTVTLALNIDTTGRLVTAKVAQSSGHAVLDQAALAAVGRARFPAAPKGLPPGRHAFTLPVASR